MYGATKVNEYGINDECSDIRAHVSDAVAYIFRTETIKELISIKSYPSRKAMQPGYNEPTAKGYIVNISDIKGLRKINTKGWQDIHPFHPAMNTSEKGKWAVSLVIDLLKYGHFPLWIEAKQTEDIKIDISGTDIFLANRQRIQVKCDYPARRTGNLYIQTHEINPLKMY